MRAWYLVDKEGWENAANIYAELYRKRFTVKDADIVIAAFCLANGYTLVTNNISDFKNIDGLQFIDWVKYQYQKIRWKKGLSVNRPQYIPALPRQTLIAGCV